VGILSTSIRSLVTVQLLSVMPVWLMFWCWVVVVVAVALGLLRAVVAAVPVVLFANSRFL
jgi:uncharacterized protein (DUF983 family)